MKQCTKCNEEKPKTEYHKDKKGREGLQSWCKQCMCDSARRSSYRRKYGMTLEEVGVMFEKQHGRCLICSVEMALPDGASPSNDAVVDHHHGTGKVRGLLCRNCNSGIGLLGDDASRLRMAAAYLDYSNDTHSLSTSRPS